MEEATLKRRIDVAAGRIPADLVIKNGKIIDVYNQSLIEGKSIAIVDGYIAGIGDYSGGMEIDAQGQYVAPGFIDGHIHIESAYVTPEEIGKLLVPRGATTIIADPHEIANVCGIDGLNYMIEASKHTKLDIKYVFPSCVPATDFEHAGAILDADTMIEPMKNPQIIGLGEFMDYPAIIAGKEGAIQKLLVAIAEGKVIDGHSPGLSGNDLNAYIAGSIHTDHECSTVTEMLERISRGVYILLREGSACHDLRTLLKGITPANSRRCLFCSDDRQPKTIFEIGHIDNSLRISVEEGIDPIIAIQIASLNAAQCYGLKDRGAIAPGLRGDIVFLNNLEEFQVNKVFIKGEEVARAGTYLPKVERADIGSVVKPFQVLDFSASKLKLSLKSNKITTIDIQPGGVLTKKGIAEVKLDEKGDFIYQKDQDIVKIAVIERHKNTGNVATALIRGYGIKSGAIAISIAHDSHNIIVVGTNDEDMTVAVEALIDQGGGIVLTKDHKLLNQMPLIVGGIMSNQSGQWVSEKLVQIHEDAHEELGINREIEPVMTLCFMSLAVIPEIKITDTGLFDVEKFSFIPLEA